MTEQCLSNRCLLEGDRNYMFRPLLAIVRFLIRKKNIWWRSGYIMQQISTSTRGHMHYVTAPPSHIFLSDEKPDDGQ